MAFIVTLLGHKSTSGAFCWIYCCFILEVNNCWSLHFSLLIEVVPETLLDFPINCLDFFFCCCCLYHKSLCEPVQDLTLWWPHLRQHLRSRKSGGGEVRRLRAASTFVHTDTRTTELLEVRWNLHLKHTLSKAEHVEFLMRARSKQWMNVLGDEATAAPVLDGRPSKLVIYFYWVSNQWVISDFTHHPNKPTGVIVPQQNINTTLCNQWIMLNVD